MTEESQTREYVVLEKALVARVEDRDTERIQNPIQTYVPIMNERAEHGPDGAVRRFTATGDEDAITQYVGEPVEKPGTYKAISWRAWSGAITKKPVVQTSTERTNDE